MGNEERVFGCGVADGAGVKVDGVVVFYEPRPAVSRVVSSSSKMVFL